MFACFDWKFLMIFKNPSNGYQEKVTGFAFLWALMFGVLYFAYKGVWRHFVIGVILNFVTLGTVWLIYPFFAKIIVVNQYRKSGCIEIEEE